MRSLEKYLKSVDTVDTLNVEYENIRREFKDNLTKANDDVWNNSRRVLESYRKLIRQILNNLGKYYRITNLDTKFSGDSLTGDFTIFITNKLKTESIRIKHKDNLYKLLRATFKDNEITKHFNSYGYNKKAVTIRQIGKSFHEYSQYFGVNLVFNLNEANYNKLKVIADMDKEALKLWSRLQ